MYIHLYVYLLHFINVLHDSNKITVFSSGVVSSMADKMSPLFKTNPQYKIYLLSGSYKYNNITIRRMVLTVRLFLTTKGEFQGMEVIDVNCCTAITRGMLYFWLIIICISSSIR